VQWQRVDDVVVLEENFLSPCPCACPVTSNRWQVTTTMPLQHVGLCSDFPYLGLRFYGYCRKNVNCDTSVVYTVLTFMRLFETVTLAW